MALEIPTATLSQVGQMIPGPELDRVDCNCAFWVVIVSACRSITTSSEVTSDFGPHQIVNIGVWTATVKITFLTDETSQPRSYGQYQTKIDWWPQTSYCSKRDGTGLLPLPPPAYSCRRGLIRSPDGWFKIKIKYHVTLLCLGRMSLCTYMKIHLDGGYSKSLPCFNHSSTVVTRSLLIEDPNFHLSCIASNLSRVIKYPIFSSESDVDRGGGGYHSRRGYY